MTLSFSKTYKDKTPTHFVDKILLSLLLDNSGDIFELEKYLGKESTIDFHLRCFQTDLCPKKHTIREDKRNRWKVGNKIHFVVNNRTTDRYQFAPVIPAISIQTIELHRDSPKQVLVDGKEMNRVQITNLARFDGFPSVAAFWDWFDMPFKGKIIHWTDISYHKTELGL